MSLLIAEDILKKAQDGSEVNAKERRHTIGFLMAVRPEESASTDLAKLFKVSERQIREDKKLIREERGKLIAEEDIGLVIADIRLSYERASREIFRQAQRAKPGSQTRLNYIRAEHDMLLKTVEALQNLGFYPKNLGTQTTNSFEYIATVEMKTGMVETHDRSSVTEEQFNQFKAKQATGLPEPQYLALPVATEEFHGIREAITVADSEDDE